MPAAVRINDKDSNGDIMKEGSKTVFIGDVGIMKTVKVTLPKEFKLEHAKPVIKTAGRYAPLDEPHTASTTPDAYPEDKHKEVTESKEKPIEKVEKKETPSKLSADCPNMTTPQYDYRLSANFTLANFSNRALFAHNITAQQGLSVSEIVCNLKHLAMNIAEPILSKYGKYQLNSGFRVGSGKSQHCKGMAMDIQWPGISYDEYLRRAKWIAENLNFDQIILERGNSYWIHVSYDHNKSSQRNQLLSMVGGGKFVSGLRLA